MIRLYRGLTESPDTEAAGSEGEPAREALGSEGAVLVRQAKV